MKTAMQKHVEYMKKNLQDLINEGESEICLLPYRMAIHHAEKMLETEKEQKIEFAKHFLYKCKDLSIVMAYNQVEQELIKYELNKSE